MIVHNAHHFFHVIGCTFVNKSIRSSDMHVGLATFYLLWLHDTKQTSGKEHLIRRAAGGRQKLLAKVRKLPRQDRVYIHGKRSWFSMRIGLSLHVPVGSWLNLPSKHISLSFPSSSAKLIAAYNAHVQ